jgi:hypothetical protein
MARDWKDKLAVFLGNEVFARAGRAAVGVFFLDLDDQFFGWFKCQADFAAVGESIGVAAFFASSGVRSTSSMLDIFSPASPDCIIL